MLTLPSPTLDCSEDALPPLLAPSPPLLAPPLLLADDGDVEETASPPPCPALQSCMNRYPNATSSAPTAPPKTATIIITALAAAVGIAHAAERADALPAAQVELSPPRHCSPRRGQSVGASASAVGIVAAALELDAAELVRQLDALHRCEPRRRADRRGGRVVDGGGDETLPASSASVRAQTGGWRCR